MKFSLLLQATIAAAVSPTFSEGFGDFPNSGDLICLSDNLVAEPFPGYEFNNFVATATLGDGTTEIYNMYLPTCLEACLDSMVPSDYPGNEITDPQLQTCSEYAHVAHCIQPSCLETNDAPGYYYTVYGLDYYFKQTGAYTGTGCTELGFPFFETCDHFSDVVAEIEAWEMINGPTGVEY
jgi:hypothetical protein